MGDFFAKLSLFPVDIPHPRFGFSREGIAAEHVPEKVGNRKIYEKFEEVHIRFHSILRTVPVDASTSTFAPSGIRRVPAFVPMMQGMPSSRETIAAWQVIPPSSVTIAAERFMAMMNEGVVLSVTRMSPCLTLSTSPTWCTTRAIPCTFPGYAETPWIFDTFSCLGQSIS